MKNYILFYESPLNEGCREEWSVFYTPSEIWSSQALCDAREQELKDLGYATLTYSLDLDTPTEVCSPW